jgi:hypothetical protein
VAHKITCGVLSSLLNLSKIGIMKFKLLEFYITRFEHTEWKFMGYVINTIYSLLQTRPYCKYDRESAIVIVTRLQGIWFGSRHLQEVFLFSEVS